MIITNPLSQHRVLAFSKYLAAFLLAVGMLALLGCGSTKVYSTDKTVTYNGALYNMGNVQRIGSRMEGQLADGSKVAMKNLDKKGVEALLKDNPEMMVAAIIEMDSQEMLYKRSKVKSYSDYSKMAKSLDSAMNTISKFMADKKKTQLKLK
jgi:hypothetical protein